MVKEYVITACKKKENPTCFLFGCSPYITFRFNLTLLTLHMSQVHSNETSGFYDSWKKTLLNHTCFTGTRAAIILYRIYSETFGNATSVCVILELRCNPPPVAT